MVTLSNNMDYKGHVWAHGLKRLLQANTLILCYNPRTNYDNEFFFTIMLILFLHIPLFKSKCFTN